MNVAGSFLHRSSLPSRGFTIVELLMTLLIVSVLATAAFPMAEVVVRRNKEQDLRRSLQQIREAIDAYKHAGDEGRIVRKAGEAGYPPTLGTLVTGVTDAKSATGQKIYFLRRIPRNPLFEDWQVPPEKTWGLRSYSSSAEDPKEGNDVYDIYVASGGIGLNGLPYREW